MKHTIKLTIVLCAGIAALTGCTDSSKVKKANAVQIQQPSDPYRTCQVLVSEMNGINEAIKRREEDTAWTPHNIVTGKAGFRVGGGLQFVDLSEASEEEIDAYQQRYEYLDLIARRKGCYI